MGISRKTAIKRSIELWKWLAETGTSKYEWPEWDKYGDTESDCFLCEYEEQQRDKYNFVGKECYYCPYSKRFGSCNRPNTPYSNWDSEITVGKRKFYAQEFLNQLKQLL